MTKDEISEAILECEERLKNLREELNKPEYGGKRWKPEINQVYWIVTDNGRVFRVVWSDSGLDSDFYAYCNVYPTQEAAEFEVERRKVIAELSDYAEGDDAVWDGNQYHYSFWYDYTSNRVDWNVDQCYKRGNLYFPSKEAALAAIEAVGEERVKKYYLRVKE